MIRRGSKKTALILGIVIGLLALLNTPALAATYPRLTASGSSWAQPAIDQWSKDVRNQGLVIDYNGNGSAAGRQDYTTSQTDFAGSDIAFLNGQDNVAGNQKEYSQYSYSYLPITAGGTAFMYQIHANGKLVRDLRLSGDTITKIFTGQIKSWSDSHITKDYGRQLPNVPIVPMVRSDPSGASFQFSAWMNHQYESQWDSFCAKYAGVHKKPCAATEQYPIFPGAKAQQGSDKVANYVQGSSGEGAIGYDEYSYAKLSNWPVVKVLNPAGYYTLPTASNVAIALQNAQIDFNKSSKTYLMQKLDHVYTNTDTRSYPVSSYSYLIVPSTDTKLGGVNSNFSAGKGKALSTWANYFLCGGQKEADDLGYSPLPEPLIKGGIFQVNKIPNHIPGLNPNNLNSCGNPTMKNGHNVLLENAVYPSKCDFKTAPLFNCDPKTGKAITTSNNNNNNSNNNNGGTNNGSQNNNSSNNGGSNNNGGTNNGTNNTGGNNTNSPTNNTSGSNGGNNSSGGNNNSGGNTPTGGNKVDPVTGKTIGTNNGNNQNTANGYTPPPANAVALAADRRDNWLLGSLTALEIAAAVLIPPILGAWLHRRRAANR